MKRFVFLLALAVPLLATAQDEKKQKKTEAGVSWSGQVIRATGSGAPNMKARSPAQARLGAERAAKLDAFRNLLEQVKGVQVSAGKTVGDQMASEEIKSKVEGLVRGYKITATRYYDDGGVEMDVEVPLAALTGALLEAQGKPKTALKTDGEEKNTGLVVDARGVEVSPALAPRLLDQSGVALYGPAFLNDEARKATGVASWVKSLEEAKKDRRVGERPLVVKAQSAKGTDLVLAAEDVKRLSASNNAYLAEGRVIIVTR